MNKEEKAFFALLRSALWKTDVPAGAISADVDWKSIESIAQRQAVDGLVASASVSYLESLEDERLEPVIDRAMQIMMRRVKESEKMNRVLSKILSSLHSAGLKPVLLKGQGCAENYAWPKLRASGDIDLWMGSKTIDVAKSIEAKGISIDRSDPKCYSLNVGDTHVEMHRYVVNDGGPRWMQLAHDWADKQLEGGDTRQISISGITATVPSVQFDAFYIFFHFMAHFAGSGLGVRQVCDWMCLLHRHHSEIDERSLEEQLRTFDLLGSWRAFGSFCIDYLGLPPEELPLYDGPHHGQASRIASMILYYGNFGNHKYGFSYDPKESTLVRKLKVVYYQVYQWLRLLWAMPHASLMNFTQFMHYALKKYL